MCLAGRNNAYTHWVRWDEKLNASFFYFDLVCQFIVVAVGYCCTWLRSVTHIQRDSPRRVIGPPRPLHAQHTTFTTNIHAPGGIRTHNPSKRAAAALRPRARDYRDQPREKVGEIYIMGTLMNVLSIQHKSTAVIKSRIVFAEHIPLMVEVINVNKIGHKVWWEETTWVSNGR
jgi:hypothetical protein